MSLKEVEYELKQAGIDIDFSGETKEDKELKQRWPHMGIGL